MQVTFGNSIQDFYLEKIRANQTHKEAKMASRCAGVDVEKYLVGAQTKVRLCFQFLAEQCSLNTRMIRSNGLRPYPYNNVRKDALDNLGFLTRIHSVRHPQQ